jgi:hypothetical protein
MRKSLIQYPGSFGCWAQSFYQMSVGLVELVGIGPTVHLDLPKLIAPFLPYSIRLTSRVQNDQIPLLKGKKSVENQYFMCKNQTCSSAMPSIELILAKI